LFVSSCFGLLLFLFSVLRGRVVSHERRVRRLGHSLSSSISSSSQNHSHSTEDDHPPFLFNPRIINGRIVDRPGERYPYFVTLFNNETGMHGCGATLITAEYVLTAAHCKDLDITTVLIGGHDNKETEQQIPIDTMFPHPLFVREYLRFDQMLVKLAEPVLLPTVRINLDVSMPEAILYNDNKHTQESLEVTVIGVGLQFIPEEYTRNATNSSESETETNGANTSSAFTLLATTLDVIPNGQCKMARGDVIDYEYIIQDDMICVKRNNTGQCHGDSGSPYLLLSEHGNPAEDVQIGIASFGIGCASDVFPSVGSRTSADPWFIRRTVCEYSHSPPPDYFGCDDDDFFLFLSDPPTPTDAPSYSSV